MNDQEFAELAEEHQGFVYNVAYRMMGNHHDAEEVAQDAFISAYRARDRFRGDAQPTTWLYRIAVNAALMRLRKDKRRKESTTTTTDNSYLEAPSFNWADSPVASALNSELGEKIKEAIEDLPTDMKTVVVLRDVQGLNNEEVCEVLNISMPALKARLHRGRVVLRQTLSDYIEQRVGTS
jgi:RNA polymerase sigma-70 factor (ECF subfamily)